MSMDTKQAVEVLVRALNTDKQYRASWVANISMSVYDAFPESQRADAHEIANKGAEAFLTLLCRERSTK